MTRRRVKALRRMVRHYNRHSSSGRGRRGGRRLARKIRYYR